MVHGCAKRFLTNKLWGINWSQNEHGFKYLGPFQIFRTLHMNITYIIRNLVHVHWMNLFLGRKIQIPVCWKLYDFIIGGFTTSITH